MNIFISLIAVALLVLSLVLAGIFLMWKLLSKRIVNNPISNKEKLLNQLLKGPKNDDDYFF